MSLVRADSGVEKISGTALDHCDMHDQWVNFVSRHIFEYRLSNSIPKERSFEIEAQCRTCEAWSVGRVTTVAGKAKLVRSAHELSHEAKARYVAYISLRGSLEFEQMHRSQNFGPFSLTLISGAEPVAHTKLGDNDTVLLSMPRDFVDQRLVKAEEACARTLDVRHGIGHLVQQSLLTLQQDANTMSEHEFVGSARLIGELILLSIGGAIDLTSQERSVRASNLARIKRAIRNNLSDPDVELSQIARECGISLSYLHNLFRDDGRTAREYLKSERLQRARHMLESSAERSQTVTDVALACGFANMSQFSTAFKGAFSVRPRDIQRGLNKQSPKH